MATQYNEQLRILIGRPLTAVSFVMDYIIFQFENAFLTSLYPPILTLSDGSELEFGMESFCNRACERIQQTVTAATDDGKEISIHLSDDSVIRVPLWHEESRGRETAILEWLPDHMLVWTPE
ncbi:MAG TPA: hypothetical protein VJ306_20435 [Pyrinomonadaceae bacterium]|jgi:hypothetical protein|nr:hypothetical protein [Pyrinomonadaceae bacterium]